MIRELSLLCVSLLLVGASCVQSQPCGWTLDGCPANAFCEPERGICVFSGDDAFRCDFPIVLSSPNQEQAAEFGESVALYGEHILVAAPSLQRLDATSPPQLVPSGATYVYRRGPESTWPNVASLVMKEVVNDQFGTSVALRRGVSAIAPGNRVGAEPAVLSIAPSMLAGAIGLSKESIFEFARLPIRDEVKGTDLVALSDSNRAVILAESNQSKVTALVYEGGFAANQSPRATSIALPSAPASQLSQILGIAADGPWLVVGLAHKDGSDPKVWRYKYEGNDYVLKDRWSIDSKNFLVPNGVLPWGEAGLKAIALSGGTLALSAEQSPSTSMFRLPRVFQLQSDGETWAQEQVSAPMPAELFRFCAKGTALRALAISGDLLVASWDSCDAVVLFRRSTRGQWDQATLLADPRAADAIAPGSPNRFGSALAVSQHKIVVGAANSVGDVKAVRPGAAYVYSCR